MSEPDRVGRALILDSTDNIAVALEDLKQGQTVEVSGGRDVLYITITENVNFGHKLATAYIPEGTDVIKYGEKIGTATAAVMPGEKVHCHNISGERGWR